MVTYTMQEEVVHALTPEGMQISQQGSHEARVWSAVPAKGGGSSLSIKDLRAKIGDDSAKIGQGRAFKNGWVGREGDGLVQLVSR